MRTARGAVSGRGSRASAIVVTEGSVCIRPGDGDGTSLASRAGSDEVHGSHITTTQDRCLNRWCLSTTGYRGSARSPLHISPRTPTSQSVDTDDQPGAREGVNTAKLLDDGKNIVVGSTRHEQVIAPTTAARRRDREAAVSVAKLQP